MRKKVGILGGMGPLATVDLFAKIVANTPAAADQDHLRILIDNNPQIPARVEAILQGAESPAPAMCESARLLEEAGADFIVMPCNTAHFWIEDLRTAVKIPVYSMIDNAAAVIADDFPHLAGGILLLATQATIDLRLYQQAFASRSIGLKLVGPTAQVMLDKAIRKVKANRVADNPYLAELGALLDAEAAAGVTAVLVGCTELPLLLPYLKTGLAMFDATLLLARLAVAKATEEC